MAETVSLRNVASIIGLVKTYNLKEVATAAESFICENWKKLGENGTLEEIMLLHPALVVRAVNDNMLED